MVKRNTVTDLDDLDKDDFKDMCHGASDKMLINLCEYELKAARGAEIEEVCDTHYEMAEIAVAEMERRGML
jgi:hypothetical protein